MNPMPSAYVLAELKYVYEALNQNESEVARFTEINRGTLQNYRSGKTQPSMENADKIAAAAATLRLQSDVGAMNPAFQFLPDAKKVYLQTVNAGTAEEMQVICDTTEAAVIGDVLIVDGRLARWQLSTGARALPIAVTTDGKAHALAAIPNYKVIGKLVSVESEVTV